jgi:UDP-N-acetylmuramoyl-L-alanyl-D-glutamate--2,6-diaminopimelate ligase
MEASSIGLAEARLAGLTLHTAIFTNFTQDHLDYHGSMDAYWRAKAQLFDWPGLRAAVINVDDPRGAELARQLAQRTGLQLWTLSCRGDASLRATQIRAEGSAMVFDLHEGQRSASLRIPASGGYNVGNVLGVVGALRSLGLSLDEALAACTAIAPVPGRMESFGGSGQPLAVVDYAHTPDALEQALLALRPVAAARGGQLWVVFGCGGDRDRLKRPLMAAAAQRRADRLVLTSDNPRTESAQDIVQEMLTGLTAHAHALIETDRARAIERVLQQAGDADVVLVAGKGHEDYQELAGQRLPFSDREQVQQALKARRSAKAGTP